MDHPIDGTSLAAAAVWRRRAIWRRRANRRREFSDQARFARALARLVGPACFWTSLENRPVSRIAGAFQKKRGVRSGIPDVMVISGGRPIFIELKSRAGVASKVQKQVRAELLSAGAMWWMARSARAALTALHRSGVVFCRPWEPPQLEPWEGPFSDTYRLPAAPEVKAERRAATQRWRERQRQRAREAEKSAGAEVAA